MKVLSILALALLSTAALAQSSGGPTSGTEVDTIATFTAGPGSNPGTSMSFRNALENAFQGKSGNNRDDQSCNKDKADCKDKNSDSK
ncbi:MAG: hypothetical protein ACRETW_05205 [Stenotrophobium sp.]